LKAKKVILHSILLGVRGPKKQHEVLCKRLKAKKVILHTILLGVGGSSYTSHTLNHLKELSLDVQKAHKTALKALSYMLTLCSMHTN